MLSLLKGIYFYEDFITVLKPIKSTTKMLILTRTEKAIAAAEDIPKNEKTSITPPSMRPRPAGDIGTNIRIVMSG
jgi:hypothetical protein